MTMTMVIPRLVTAALVAASAFAAIKPSSAASADPTGTWLTEDGRARVRTERCGPQDRQLCGYIVWTRKTLNEKGQPRTDSENPDPEKQSRLVLGHQMILGLKPNKDSRYEGKIYNADNGKSYDVTIWSETSGELSVQGCMLALLCGNQIWKRVTDILPGQLQGRTDEPNGPHADREWAVKNPAMTGSTNPRRDQTTTSRPARAAGR